MCNKMREVTPYVLLLILRALIQNYNCKHEQQPSEIIYTVLEIIVVCLKV